MYMYIHFTYILCIHTDIHIYEGLLQVELFVLMAPTFNLLYEPQ